MDLKFLISKLILKLQIPSIRNSRIDKTARVCSASNVVDVKMGRYSYIGNCCTAVNVEIGNFCSIGDHCIIGGASHPIEWVSTSPVFHSGRNILKKNFSAHSYKTSKRTVIGNDVWIGDCCLIRSGVIIGDGAVVGMGSVLTKDVEPYAIVAGNPARELRKRFDKDTIEALIKSRWWNRSDDDLKRMSVDIEDPCSFLAAGGDNHEDRAY